jgi:hypothetical protein
MLINEKVYRKKSPEAIALESTLAHFTLFKDKHLDETLMREATQASIEAQLLTEEEVKGSEKPETEAEVKKMLKEILGKRDCGECNEDIPRKQLSPQEQKEAFERFRQYVV